MQAVKTQVHANGEKHHLIIENSPPAQKPRPPQPRPRNPWYRRTWVLVLASSTLLLVVLSSVLLAVYWPYTQARVISSLERTLSGKVTFASFHGTHFPHPGFVAEGVVLTHPLSPPGSPPFATAKRLTMQSNYVDLFTRQDYIARAVLEGLRIHIPALHSNAASRGSSPSSSTSPTSNTDTKSHTRLGEVVADGAYIEIARREGREPLKFYIHSLTLNSVREDGPFSYRIAFHNPLPPGEIHSRGRLGPWNSSDPAQTPLYGTYSFDAADLSVFHGIAGMLSSQGDFQGRLGHIGTQGSINIPDFMVTRSHHAVPLRSQFRASVNGLNGDVYLDRVDTTILQTQVAASANIAGHSGQPGKTTSIDLTVSHGRIQDVMRLFVRAPRPPLNGTTNIRAHVTIPPGHERFLQKIHLVGDFDVAGGRFTHPERQVSIKRLSDRAGGKKPNDLQGDDPDSIASNLAGHVDLQHGTATFTDLSFSVPNAVAQMHGTYNLLNERVDLHGTLQTTAKFSQTVSGVKSVLLKPLDLVFHRKPQGASIPVKLTGTYSHPQPGLDIPPK